jgi:hypothetical protein
VSVLATLIAGESCVEREMARSKQIDGICSRKMNPVQHWQNLRA